MADICVYEITTLVTKVSLLLLYLRIFKVAREAAIMVWTGIVFITMFYLASFAAQAAMCFPRGSENWFDATLAPRCGMPQVRLAAVQGVVGILTDFYALAIPFVLVTRLQMTNSKKAGVAAIFLTGLMYV